MTATAISSDGSRVEWNNSDENDPHLYMREVPQQETLQVDERQEGVPQPKSELPALFQTASADGSKVFFTDEARLTSDSHAPGDNHENGAYQPDLYVFEPAQPAGHRVTDLSVPLHKDEVASVQGSVIGASEDGSTVYFVANGILGEHAQAGSCGQPGGTGCNLYVVHDGPEGWETPVFIARLSTEDNPAWGEPTGVRTYHLPFKPSEVSSNGEYVAFMSKESLTGYDNTDTNSGVRDEEVFIYSRKGGSGQLDCASCNPSGAQPAGVFDTEASSEGQGLLVDRELIWGGELNETMDRWVAGLVPGWTLYDAQGTGYQPRYLSNDGRLFFDSSDPLVPRDTNGKMDVYEFEPEKVGSCTSTNTPGGCVALISSGESDRESAFLDASETGNDVFFLTAGKLTSSDTDTGMDVYDARVCQAEGAEPCPQPAAPTPVPCNEESTCKPPAHGQESYETPSSAMVTGSGNVQKAGSTVLGSTTTKGPTSKPPTKAQLLAKALKACHKIKHKNKRVACEKRAHKRYGGKVSSAKKAVKR